MGKTLKEYNNNNNNNKTLQPRDNVERLYALRKERGRGLASIEDNIDVSIQQLKDYKEKHKGGMITATRKDSNNTMDNRLIITRKHKWDELQLYGHFKQLINNVSLKKT